jgi:hypothetical protein
MAGPDQEILKTTGDASYTATSLPRYEILRPTGGSLTQTIVSRYKEIGDILRTTKHQKKASGTLEACCCLVLDILIQEKDTNT